MDTGADQYTVMVDSWVSPGGVVAIQSGDGKFYTKSDLYKYDDNGDVIGLSDWEERYAVPRAMWKNTSIDIPPLATGLLCVDGVWVVFCTDAIYLTYDFGEDEDDWVCIQESTDADKPIQYHTVGVMPKDVGSSGHTLPLDQNGPIRTPITANTYTGTRYYTSVVKRKTHFYREKVGNTTYLRCYYFEVDDGGTIQILGGSCTCIEFSFPKGTEMGDIFAKHKQGTLTQASFEAITGAAITNPDTGYGAFLACMQNLEHSVFALWFMGLWLRSIPNMPHPGVSSQLIPENRFLLVVKGKPKGVNVRFHGADLTTAASNGYQVGMSSDGTKMYFSAFRYYPPSGGNPASGAVEVSSLLIPDMMASNDTDILLPTIETVVPTPANLGDSDIQAFMDSVFRSICPHVVTLQSPSGVTPYPDPSHYGIDYAQPVEPDSAYRVKIFGSGALGTSPVFTVDSIPVPPSILSGVDYGSPTVVSSDEEDMSQAVLILCAGELCVINPTGTGVLPDGFIQPVTCLGSSIINNEPVERVVTITPGQPGPRYRYSHIPYSF